MTTRREERIINLGPTEEQALHEWGEHTRGSVKKRKTTPPCPVPLYISVRTRICFPIFIDTPEHNPPSCRIRVSSLQVHQYQKETQLQSGDPSSMIGLFNKIRELITCR